MEKSSDVTIIGGGLAGCALAYVLGSQNLSVTLIERSSEIASGASGNPQGLIVPYITNTHTVLSNVYAEGFKLITEYLPTQQTGALQLPSTTRIKNLLERTVKTDLISPECLAVDPQEASSIAGITLSHPALFYPHARTVEPKAVCAQWLQDTGSSVTVQLHNQALKLTEGNGSWIVEDNHSLRTESKYLVIANAHDCLQFDQTKWLKVEKVRGELITVNHNSFLSKLLTPLCYDGYVLPEHNGEQLIGASYDHGIEDPDPSPIRHKDMLKRLNEWLPELPPLTIKSARVSFRTSTHDRIPYIGHVNNFHEAQQQRILWQSVKSDTELPTYKNLFVSVGHGSRGLITSYIGATIIAAKILKRPSSASIETQASVSPERLFRRYIRREELLA